MIGIEECVNLIEDYRVEITEVRTEEGNEISLEELKEFVNKSEERFINCIDGAGQMFCIGCLSKDRELVAFDVKNKTQDFLFLKMYFEGEIYDFEKLVELLGKENVIPRGIIDGSFRKVFGIESSFDVRTNVITIDDDSYPYKIYRDDFSFFRYTNSKWIIGCSDVWLLICYKDGRSVNLCISD